MSAAAVFYHSGGDLMYAPPGAAPYRLDRMMGLDLIALYAEEWIALTNHGAHAEALQVRRLAEALHGALIAQGKWRAAACR